MGTDLSKYQSKGHDILQPSNQKVKKKVGRKSQGLSEKEMIYLTEEESKFIQNIHEKTGVAKSKILRKTLIESNFFKQLKSF